MSAKLWCAFALFAVLILALLWVTQTVLLQGSYHAMVKRGVKRAAAAAAESLGKDRTEDALATLARENSLLIVVTDEQGTLLYSADEHSAAYTGDHDSSETDAATNDNPYSQGEDLQNWQIGRQHYLGVPAGYGQFLIALKGSANGTTESVSGNGNTFVYGLSTEVNGQRMMIYISATLEAVGATIAIIRTQLMWTTLVAQILAWFLAWTIARIFPAP